LASSSTLVGLTPNVNEACRWSLVTCGDRTVGAPPRVRVDERVVASDFMPSRTAMSTTSGTPVNSSSLTNAVFGEVARRVLQRHLRRRSCPRSAPGSAARPVDVDR
jgi:hypothetical protein